MSDLLAELEWRGFIHHATRDLAAHLAAGRRTLYCGFDPTAPSFQVGNLMPLMLLRHFQLAGHRPIVLMGGGTGFIGDPSGKKSERPLLSEEQIRENVRRQRDQLVRLFDFDAKETRALVLNNADWLVDQRLVAFLRDVGKHFSVNVMMQKESVKARLDAGISYTEFSYMLLQAYAPLFTTASGAKFGKTEAGAVWLDPALTSPYKLYQFWMNTDDRDAELYLKLFTLLPQDEIKALLKSHHKEPGRREAQKKLAIEVTQLVHGDKARYNAVAASAILFDEFSPRNVELGAFETLAQEIPTVALESADGLTLVDAVVRTGLAKSKSEARRAIEQGGIYVNQERVKDVARTLGPSDWLGGGHLLLRKGKKDYGLLRVAR